METIDYKALKAKNAIYFTSENGLFENKKLTVFCNGVFWIKFNEDPRLRWNKKENRMETVRETSMGNYKWEEIKGTVSLTDPLSNSDRIDYIKANIDNVDPAILETIYDMIKEYKPTNILR